MLLLTEVFARIYLGVDHPSDATVGVMFSIAVAVVVFKLFVPDSVFPVAYSHGKSAHLDVSGKRGEAIKQAVQDQLGLEVTYLGYVGLAGSAGSTPLQMNVRRDADSPEATMIFAKLYAQSHLRADRWYKWGRTVVYGTLEDEVRFTSVRRLVEYEDYMMRVMRDAGIPCALPYGFVEITPEREYLIVTEFLDGAVEISEVELTDDQIDEGSRGDPEPVGRRTGPPRRQTGQHHGARRARGVDRRRVRAGSTNSVASGCRSRQHDARARPEFRSRSGLQPGPSVLLT